MNQPRAKKASRRRAFAFMACAALAISAAMVVVEAVQACGPFFSLRSYLTRSFWLPMYFRITSLLPEAIAGGAAPYAGFSAEAVPAALSNLRAAYIPLSRTTRQDQPQSAFEEARRAAARALARGVLSGKNLEEARLIDCKIALRMAELNRDSLDGARRKLEEFIASAENQAFASEARGWLARILYLQRDYVRAALIYLDETDASDSPLKRDTLVTSLRWVYSDGEMQMWDRAQDFFDTPRHALFLVNLVTNQRGSYYPHSEITKEHGGKVMALLQKHPELFKSGADSDALIMALMRTSLYLGDLASTLKYAAAVPKIGVLMQNPEFNWMTAIARFVQRDFAGAEGPLLRMLNAPSATPEDRGTAAQALVGVYMKTDRKVDALHAAFIQVSQPLEASENGPDILTPRMQWCSYCQDLELPYLLDIFLSDAELRAYLKRYPEPVGPEIRIFNWYRRSFFSAPQVVQYSLAVRLARREKYAEAAKIFTELGAAVRAGRMQALAELFARANDSALPEHDRLAALFDYGDYLASNPDCLFFNDLLWFRMQINVFQEQYAEVWKTEDPYIQPGWTRVERETILADDRRLRDQQEERWKAFHVLERVALQAGHSELGRKAAKKLIECLNGIRTDRFGRAQEISNAISTWKRWLDAR